MSYPTTLDTGSSLPNPSTSSNTNNPSHAGLHASENAAIIATETKLGTGASTPASNTLLIGTGAGTSAWSALTSAQLAAVLSDETGTGSAVFANTPVLITPKVDTINENTVGNGTTVNGVLIKSNKINGSFITDRSLTHAQLATGVPVQTVNFETGAVATGTTVMPADDTIPQNTEGDQYMTLAITPKSATNTLVIQTVFMFANTTVQIISGALFQDSTAGALAAIASTAYVVGAPNIMTLLHKMTSGTTSSTTFKFRAGTQGTGTLTFNGVGGGRYFGGVAASSITITEVAV